MRNDMFFSMVSHYHAACVKHPYFADFWTENAHELYERDAREKKNAIKRLSEIGEVSARLVLYAELAEVFEAITRGDYGQAREEIFDAIAVLMRMVDVIDGAAKFGNPRKVDRRCANNDCRNNDSRGVCMRKGGRCRCGNCPKWDGCTVANTILKVVAK